MMSVEDHRAVLHDLMRRDHEEYVAQIREWAETAEAEGRVAAARQHRPDQIALDYGDQDRGHIKNVCTEDPRCPGADPAGNRRRERGINPQRHCHHVLLP